DEGRGGGARICLARCRDGIFEIEDQRIGRARESLHQLAFTVRRHEKHRTQGHHLGSGLRSISAWRFSVATSSPRWLKPWCRKVTMPAFGRDWLARSSSTVVRERSVSPAKTGNGKRTSVIPRLATVVPSVVSCTDRPITRPSVKILFISGRPNSVPAQYSASMWIAAG